jgi:hypothetical protein
MSNPESFVSATLLDNNLVEQIEIEQDLFVRDRLGKIIALAYLLNAGDDFLKL